MARHLSTVARARGAWLLAGVLALGPALAAAQEQVPLQSFLTPPAFFGCDFVQPDKVQQCKPSGVCDWVDPPAYYQCSWKTKGLSGGDRIQLLWECCADPGRVGLVVQVSDTINSLKGLTVGADMIEVTGRGQSFPFTPELRAGPLQWDPTDTTNSNLALAANRRELYKIPLSDLRPYVGRIAVFRWVSDWGSDPGWGPFNRFATAGGAPIDGTLLEEPKGALWGVFGEARFPLPNVATTTRLFPTRLRYRGYDGDPARNVRSIPDDGTLLREESGKIWVIAGGARFWVPDPPTQDRLYAGSPVTQLWDGAADLIPGVPRDEALLREESGAIWVMLGRARFHVPDEPTLGSLFAGWPVFQLWDGAVAGIPEVPIDETLLAELDGTTWVVLGGARFHVPDPTTYRRLYGFREPFRLWNGAQAEISLVPIDGTLLREESGAFWEVAGRAKFAVPDLQTVRRVFPGKAALLLWNGALSQVGDTPADGALLREERDGISVVYGGAPFRLPDEYTRTRLFSGRPVQDLWSGALARLPAVPVDGTLLKEEVGRTWVIAGGARFAFPDPPTLQRLFPGRSPPLLWSGALDRLPTIPVDDTLLREENGTISAVYGGARFAVPDPGTLQRFFHGRSAFQLWNGALAGIPTAPRDGTLVREEDGTRSVVYGGARFTAPDLATYQRLFALQSFYVLWTGALGNIPTVPVDGTLLREESGAIWVVYGGAKFHVPDPATLTRLFPGRPAFQLWDGALGGIGPIPHDGTCLREEGNPEQVYLVSGGCKSEAIPRLVVDASGSIHQVYDPSCRRMWSGALSAIPACP